MEVKRNASARIACRLLTMSYVVSLNSRSMILSEGAVSLRP